MWIQEKLGSTTPEAKLVLEFPPELWVETRRCLGEPAYSGNQLSLVFPSCLSHLASGRGVGVKIWDIDDYFPLKVRLDIKHPIWTLSYNNHLTYINSLSLHLAPWPLRRQSLGRYHIGSCPLPGKLWPDNLPPWKRCPGGTVGQYRGEN